MWNTFIASYVFNHRSVNDLLRELSRNSQLRQVCGIKPRYRKEKDGTYKMYIVPSEAAHSRFLSNLLKSKKEMKEAFEGLVKYMYENLEGFGEELAGAGKAIQSYAKATGKGKDRRVFTPIARDSKKWKREYKKRTSVKQENGRLDRDYGFELHTIRGKEKIEMCITMAFLVQLSMAKGKIKQNKKERLSTLVA